MSSCKIAVRVTPGAKEDRLLGWEGEVLRLRLRAAAVEGKANSALIKFLAASLGLRQRDLTIEQGRASRRKLVAIAGLTAAQTRRRLNNSIGE